MEARARELLELPDTKLFAHGGCHVFALALHEFTGLPLLAVTERDGPHDHLGCRAEDGRLVDCFGWFTKAEYVREDRQGGKIISFALIGKEAIKSRFILGRGCGYYAHPEFLEPAAERARAWIGQHRKYFDGTEKTIIPGFSRVQKGDAKGIWSVR